MKAESIGEMHSMLYGDETISYELRRGLVNRLRISVYPDLRVVVHAPVHASAAAIGSEVRRRGAWVLRHLAGFRDMPPRAVKHYVSGESVIYLGRQYRLKVVEGPRAPAKLRGKFLCVSTLDKSDTDAVRRSVRRWYRGHAHRIFELRLAECLAIAQRHEIPTPSLHIRWMKTRWGSTPGTDRILLNTQLVKTPTYCIDYVITHELCHLRHPHHGKEFYRLLSRCMPDWKTRKARLEDAIL